MSQADFAKRQRERAKREKLAAKSAKKEERRSNKDATAADGEEGAPVDEGAVLAELAALHARFDAEEIDFETFAAAKEELTARLIS